MNIRAIVKEYQTQVMKSFEFCKRMFANGFNSEEQFNTALSICQNHIKLCTRLCKTVKPRFGWFQITAQKNFETLYDTCIYTVDEIKSMIQETQDEFDKIAEIEELREKMETKAFIEYDIAQKIKQFDLDKIDEIKTYNKIGFNINTEDNE